MIPLNHIVFTEFDGGEGLLVDLNTKKYYQLNETAMLVWRCLEKGKTRSEVIEELTAVYEVTSEHAAQSVERLLRNLQSHQLVRSN